MSEGFAERWRRKECESGFAAIASKMVSCGAWLLPRDAAPCLSFDRAEHPVPVWEVFASPSDWSTADRARLAPYRVIGSDGAGNPMCVEQSSGTVWVLDHEDWFRGRQFVNGSVSQLAECLLAYMGEREAERFRQAVREIDARALTEGAFWGHEAAGLEAG